MYAIKPIFTVPSRNDRHIYWAVFYGVILLVWLSTESTYMPLTAALGGGVSVGIMAFLIMHRFGGQPVGTRRLLIVSSLVGAITGALAVPMTFFLMLFKNVQHSHYYAPDFPNETLLGIWERLPFWLLAGALFGLAWALWIVANNPRKEIGHESNAA